jgi:hypothetical protein
MKTASWVIRVKASKRVVCETFDSQTVRELDTNVFEAVPILAYLQDLNRTLREQGLAN